MQVKYIVETVKRELMDYRDIKEVAEGAGLRSDCPHALDCPVRNKRSPQLKVSRRSETRSDTVVRYVDKVKTDSCYIYEARQRTGGGGWRHGEMEQYIYRYRDRIKTDTLIRGDTITHARHIEIEKQ